MTFCSPRENFQLSPSEPKCPGGNTNLATLAVAPSDSEEEEVIEFDVDEQVIDNLLGDDSESEK